MPTPDMTVTCTCGHPEPNNPVGHDLKCAVWDRQFNRQARTVYHPDQWHHILYSGLLPTIQQWLRDNRIDPSDIPTHTPITIEDRDGQRVIAYSAYLHDADGHKYIDPEKSDEAATEQRTSPCLAEPPQALLDLSADL